MLLVPSPSKGLDVFLCFFQFLLCNIANCCSSFISEIWLFYWENIPLCLYLCWGCSFNFSEGWSCQKNAMKRCSLQSNCDCWTFFIPQPYLCQRSVLFISPHSSGAASLQHWVHIFSTLKSFQSAYKETKYQINTIWSPYMSWDLRMERLRLWKTWTKISLCLE